ncbi:MAG: hypothetical protein KA450_01375 [Bacteroidia bacterium]|nr:hypothetical protein [Bacteroidota bacterium]MBP6412068.1 hypothetical protein [Bacteroidia bacterium]
MKISKLKCDCCEKEFSATRSDAKFCSAACKQRVHNKRIRLGKLSESIEQCHQAEKNLENQKAKYAQFELDKKAEQEQFLQIQKEFGQKIIDLKNQFKIDDEKRKKDFADRTLKGWLEKIMRCAEYEEIRCGSLLIILNQIKRKFTDESYSFPIDYKHYNFVNFTLKACLDIWIHETDNADEHYVSFSIPEEILKDFEGIVQQTT